MDELSELKNKRKLLGLTQSELAQRANVSQSLIAKIESGKIDPSYENAKKIFETLALLDKDNEMTARDIMHKKIISAESGESLKQAITKMREKNISQMPVMENNKAIGYISEATLLDNILEGRAQSKVSDVMQPGLPIIPPDTSQGVVANLLKHFPLILVENRGAFAGIITKADLLKSVWK